MKWTRKKQWNGFLKWNNHENSMWMTLRLKKTESKLQLLTQWQHDLRHEVRWNIKLKLCLDILPKRTANFLVLQMFKGNIENFDKLWCKVSKKQKGSSPSNQNSFISSRYGTVREEKGECYLFMKTVERAHLPSRLWEKIKLPRNYQKALEIIDEELKYWSVFQKHKCKQRLTKLHQMIIWRRRLKLNQMEKIEPIRWKFEKREANRERKAL